MVPLSSSGLLARLRVVRPELGLWARAAANFWAKSLQSVKDCFHYTRPAIVMHVCLFVCVYPKGKKLSGNMQITLNIHDDVLRTCFALKTVCYPHVLSPVLSRTNSSSRLERDTTRRICSHTSADWGHTVTPDTLVKKTLQTWDIIRAIKIEIEDTSLAHSDASKSYLADSISKNIKTLINQTIFGAWSTSVHGRTR